MRYLIGPQLLNRQTRRRDSEQAEERNLDMIHLGHMHSIIRRARRGKQWLRYCQGMQHPPPGPYASLAGNMDSIHTLNNANLVESLT